MPSGSHTPRASVPHLDSEAVAEGPSHVHLQLGHRPMPLPRPGHTFLAREAREQQPVISRSPRVTLPGDILRRTHFFLTCLRQPSSPAPFSRTLALLKPIFRLLFCPGAQIPRTYSPQRASSVTVLQWVCIQPRPQSPTHPPGLAPDPLMSWGRSPSHRSRGRRAGGWGWVGTADAAFPLPQPPSQDLLGGGVRGWGTG